MNNRLNMLFEYNYIVNNKYYGKLTKEDDFIALNVEFDNINDFNAFKIKKNSVIEISSVVDSKKFYLFICDNLDSQVGDKLYKLKFDIDKISEYKIKDLEEKTIDSIKVKFDNINWFIPNKQYLYQILNDGIVKFPDFSQKYVLKGAELKINSIYGFLKTFNELTINKEIWFSFKFYTKKSFNEINDYIYIFRNLLMLIGKQNINVENLVITNCGKNYEIFDCVKKYNFNPINKNLKKYLDKNNITLDSIDNFAKIVNNFYDEYQKLLTIAESYFDCVNYSMAAKVEFINATTMIEDFSEKYMSEQTKIIQYQIDKECKNGFISKIINVLKSKKYIDLTKEDKIIKDLNQIVYKSKEISFQSKVLALISSVNAAYNFSNSEMELIAFNIKETRMQCIHKGTLTDIELSDYFFRQGHFIEELILLNIYKIIGLDYINKKACYLNFYYTKEELLRKINITEGLNY